jgi:uncharacterized protein involved in response to NO
VAASAWAPVGPARYGISSTQAPSNAHSELHALSTPAEGAANEVRPLHPSNPLFAFGAIALVTFGFMAFSTSVRVGHTKAALNIGDAK